jgi:hypothetical protein
LIQKNMKVNFVRLLTMAVATVGCVFNASATVDVYYKVDNGKTSKTSSGYQDLETFNVKFNSTTYNGIFAGGEMLTQTGTGHAVNTSMPLNYVSICTDFLGSLYIGSTYAFAPVSISGQTGIDPGWNNPALAIQNADELFMKYGDVGSGGIGTGGGPTLTVEDMAALQLAVWMSLYDTESNGKVDAIATAKTWHAPAYTPEFQVTGGSDSGAISLALSWVASLTGNYDNAGSLLKPDLKLGSQHNPDGQYPQELLYCSSVPLSSVPEPATILAGVLLLLPLGVSTIRSLRKSRIA